jgi:hypothetical protein
VLFAGCVVAASLLTGASESGTLLTDITRQKPKERNVMNFLHAAGKIVMRLPYFYLQALMGLLATFLLLTGYEIYVLIAK